jgi:hypothetical protein
MALTIKHRSDGSFFEQGDTQSLTPFSARSLEGQFAQTQGESTVYSFRPLRVNSYTDQGSGLTLIDGIKFVAKTSGTWLVNFGRMRCSTTAPATYRLVIKQYHSDDTDYVDTVETVSNQASTWIEGSLSYSITLAQGDYFKMGTFDYYPTNININGDEAIARFDIVNLAPQVPYIVASKGALVSDGAFQFDENGNGYTENYDETQAIHIGWYKRADGKRKPVWRQIFDIPQYATVPGDVVTVEIAPYGLMEILLDVRGWVVTTANPASYTPLLMNNSITSGTDFHMRWCGLYPQENKGLLLRDRTGSAWGALTFYGKAFVTFTKQSDVWA